MPTYKCIIVDDEPIAIRVIKNHLSNFEEFEVVAECSNAIEAMKVLRSVPVDLLFLDIEMPTLSGLEMLKTLPHVPMVIFITAHRNYAVEAFDINALDYLLKPVSLERFAQSLNRFLDQKKPLGIQHTEAQTDDWILLKADKKNLKIPLSEILYIESMADYVLVHLSEKKLITRERISLLEEKLPSSVFLRVHRGYIVNIQKVTAWYGHTLEIDKVKIPIGRNYKAKTDRIFCK